jgi:tetratricopeptide (TPR) repeat protein
MGCNSSKEDAVSIPMPARRGVPGSAPESDWVAQQLRRGGPASEAPRVQRNVPNLDVPPPAKQPFDADKHLLENLVRFLADMDEESPKYSEILAWYAFLKAEKYEADGRQVDLLDAISRLKESVSTTPEGDPKLGHRLHLLGHLLEYKFQAAGQLEDLDDAIFHGKLAILAPPDKATDLAQWHQDLASMYRVRFEQNERVEDLDEAILSGEAAVNTAPDDQPGLTSWLNNLATAYEWRFEQTGRMEDLGEGIRAAKKVVDLTPNDDPTLSGRLHNLAQKLDLKFDRTKEIHDLDNAILQTRVALRLLPEGHYCQPGFRGHLESMLKKRQNPTSLRPSRMTGSSTEDPLLVYEKIYSNLKLAAGQTRLLSIKRGYNGPRYPPPVCTLRVVNLQQPPPYVSLSYTWGSQAFDHTLQVNGQILSVTRSCCDVLRLLLAHGCTEVWIDQICIDQSNLAERGQQVSLMDKIYHGARSVYIWLGRTGSEEWLDAESDDTLVYQSESAFAYRRGHRIDSNPAFWQKVLTWRSKLSGSYNLDNTVSLMLHLGDLLADPGIAKNERLLADEWAWVGFVDILARPYYHRRWTIQEHCTSSEVHILFGDRKIDWKVVQDAAMCLIITMKQVIKLQLPIPHCCGPFLEASSRELDNIFTVIGLKVTTQACNKRAFPLLELLRKCKGTRIMQPQDKIYSLLSLIAERNILPQVDYNIHASVVFRECMVRLIETGQGTEVLLLAGHRANQIALEDLGTIQPSSLPDFATSTSIKLPSQSQTSGNDLSRVPTWCPHFLWDLHPTSFPLCWSEFNQPEQLPNAVGSTQCRVRVQKQYNRLVVEGSIIDSVVDVQRPLAEHGVDVDEFLVFQRFAAAYAKHNDISIRENHLVRRMLHSMEKYQSLPPSLIESNKYDKLDVALRILQIPIEELPLAPPIRLHMILFVQQTMIKENSSRRLCATAQGYIGVCSYKAQQGDKVALLHGVPMLMVLRPAADNSYEILGDAYFAGLGHGGALELPTYVPRELTLV